KLPGRVTAQNATRLDQCVQLVSTTTDPKDTQKVAERGKAIDDCVQILEPVRLISSAQALDIDRLRLMKEYAKDAHDHRQAFRTFWLQAAQLVLLNLLLPLLTALLGYIFGSARP